MATVYVKKTGNNSNSGARTAPVLDIARAAQIVVDSAENDSEIIIMDSLRYYEGGIGSGNPTVTMTGLTIMAETGSDGMPVVSPVLQGSGSGNSQNYALFCAAGWTIKGLTFRDYDIASSTANGVIRNRDPVGPAPSSPAGITVELCTFQHLTGTCINFGNGGYTPQGSRYHSDAPTGSRTTMDRLNGLPNVNIHQKNFQWFLNGEEWDGQFIKVE